MPVFIGSLAGATASALLWDLSLQQFMTNAVLAALIFGGGIRLIKVANRQR